MSNGRNFDQTSNMYLEAADSASLSIIGSFTLEAWIKPTTNNAQNVIVSKWNTSHLSYMLSVESGIPKCYARNGATEGTRLSSATISTGMWYHISCVYTSGSVPTLDMYVNGLLANGTLGGTLPTALVDTTSNVRIGNKQDGSSTSSFNGLIDEVRISNIARTPEEIKASASRRPYSVYTSDVIDFTSNISSWNPLTWSEHGVATGDGETLASSTSLVAHWKFNETTGTTADNAEGTAAHDGTLTNFASTTSQDQAAGTGWTSANKRWGAGALMFDGAGDYVSITDSAVWDFASNNFTFEYWVKMNTLEDTGFFGQSDGGGNNFKWGLYWNAITANKLTFHNNTNTGTVTNISWDWIPTIGKWQHIVITRSGNNWYLYVDGVAVNSPQSSALSVANSSANPRIGSDGEAWKDLNGTLDSFRLYSRALGASEIMSNYQSGNIEIQTRVGADTSPDDGSWEAWRPTTGETAIETYDGPYQYNTTDSGLVSYWPMDETADNSCSGGQDVCDRKSSSHATDSGGSKIVDGKFGKARKFDGTDDIAEVNDNTTRSDAITVEAWVKLDALKDYNGIFSWGADGDSNGSELYVSSTGAVTFRVRSGSGTQDELRTSSTNITTGNWYHLTATQASIAAAPDVYINGVLVNGTNQNETPVATAGDKKIGFGEIQNGYTNGIIDEVRIYSSALSAATIQQHYLEGTTRPETLHPMLDSTYKIEGSASQKIETGRSLIDGSTVALWHLDETGGSSAYIKDSTANANNGTPTGTTVVQGISGKARSFNGSSDYISTADVGDNISNLTIESWIKINSTGTAQTIIGKDTEGAGGRSFQFRVSSSNVAQLILCSDTNCSGNTTANGVTALKAGTWYHVAAVFSTASTIKIYLNGVEDSSTATTIASVPNTSTTTEFGRTQNNSTYYSGVIDESRVTNVARSAEEIAEAYRAGRDHYINKTISSTNLTSITSLPFYVAADRPGSYLSATIGESAYANYQPDTNTVGFWHLDEQSGSGAYIKDASGNANHGTPTGAAYAQGKIGKGRSFNGSSHYISTPNHTSLQITNGTVETWVKLNSHKNYNVLVDKYNFSTARNGYSLFTGSSGTAQVQIGNGSTFNSTSSTLAISTGTWNHLAFTMDGSNLKLYINGQLAGSTTQTITPTYTSDDLQIGVSTDFAGTYADGIIDEVRISNTARTADEIRQAYEVGLRTHPITIDFGAKLSSDDLITGSGDYGFEVDATYYGLQQQGDQLFKGDKIIIRENYDGTEYIAQGTVTAITASSGATTVAAWDAGSTFPSGGYTANASVFKWQREYWSVNNEVLDTHVDAITNLSLRLTDGSEGRTIWLDDLRSSGGYLTTNSGSTITSSTGYRYGQYRAVLTSLDEAVSATMSAVTLDYTTNNAPSAPTTPYAEGASNPTNILDLTPEFSAVHSDPDSDAANYYEIEVNTASDFTGTVMWDTGSTSMSNLASGVRSTDVSYAGTALSFNGTTYYWRIRFTDVNGATSAWSTTQNFVMSNAPATPSLDSPTDTATNQSITPVLKTTTTDAQSDYLRYKIELCTNVGMTTNCQTFDQTSSQTGWSGQDTQTNSAYSSGTQGVYAIQTPLNPGVTYYWRSYAIDPAGSNTWGATQGTPYSFTTTLTGGSISCLIQEALDDGYLNVVWTDNASSEAGFDLQRSVNGGGFSAYQTIPANTTSYQDTSISQGNTYAYKVASYVAGPIYSNYCTTDTVSIQNTQDFDFKGLNMQGITLQ